MVKLNQARTKDKNIFYYSKKMALPDPSKEMKK